MSEVFFTQKQNEVDAHENVVVEWLTILLRIRQVPGFNLGPGDRLS
jgi:hypothetical protein